MTEHNFQNYVRKELSKLGYITFRCNVGKIRTIDNRWFDTGLPKGFSDLIALKNGKLFFIETKAPKGKPSTDQINFINQMKKNGFAAGIAYNMNDVFEILKGS
ncbi:MAG: VRR-NUC domain-containing protein [Spirochaetes bacterium]|nr:VRR-NUC domain-containing protein [Spirochaetota bacterium]